MSLLPYNKTWVHRPRVLVQTTIRKKKKKRPNNRLTRFTVDGRVNVAEYSRAENFAELKTVAGVRQVVHVQSVGAEFLCAAVSHGATAASACILRRCCARRTLHSFRFRSVDENRGRCVLFNESGGKPTETNKTCDELFFRIFYYCCNLMHTNTARRRPDRVRSSPGVFRIICVRQTDYTVTSISNIVLLLWCLTNIKMCRAVWCRTEASPRPPVRNII